LMQRPPS